MKLNKEKQAIIMVIVVVITMALFAVLVKQSIGNNKMVKQISQINKPVQNQERDNQVEENDKELDNNLDEKEKKKEKQQKEPEIITSDIDTSDWQTYRNEEYGFEVKYPKEWINDNFKKGKPLRDPITGEFASFFQNQNDDLKFFIYIDKEDDFNGFDYTFKEKIVSLDDKKIFLFDNNISRIGTFYKKNNLVYLIYWDSSVDKNIEIFKNIINNFKFIN